MMRTGEPCALRAGHAGQHRSAGSVERRRAQRRASERDRRADDEPQGGAQQLELLHENRPDLQQGAGALGWNGERYADPEHRAREPMQMGAGRAIGIMGPWARLRDRMRARAAANAANEATLAELLGTDEDERRASDGPWSSV